MVQVQELRHRMFINGEWVDSSSGDRIDVHNPSTGSVIEKVPAASLDDVHKAVDAAKAAFDKGGWGKAPPGDRADCLLRVAAMLEQKLEDFET